MTKTSRAPWIDYLRGFLTLLVVAHHAALAYTTFASFNKNAYINSTHPVVDVMRWKGMDYFEDFNDIFFMSLMFLISGIFVIGSLQKKGPILFIKERCSRLLIPFLVGVTLLMLIAHYPAYYLAYGNWNFKSYVVDFFTVEAWPVGPPWFLWVLLLFNLIFSALFPAIKSVLNKAAKSIADARNQPIKILFIWYVITWLTYTPMMLWAGSGTWTGIGPFDFQVSRIFLYFSYFIIGIAIGSSGTDKGLFSSESLFMKRWPLWVCACVLTYVLLKLSEAPLTNLYEEKELNLVSVTLIYRSIWTLSCTLSSIAFITLFKRIFQRGNSSWQLLSENAYGIYLFHYPFVIWCQFLLLKLDLSAFTKFTITITISVLGSWALTYMVRKNKTVARYL